MLDCQQPAQEHHPPLPQPNRTHPIPPKEVQNPFLNFMLRLADGRDLPSWVSLDFILSALGACRSLVHGSYMFKLNGKKGRDSAKALFNDSSSH